jgi:hypothetical protein
MYVTMTVLFSAPLLLLCLAGHQAIGVGEAQKPRDWRLYDLRLSVVLASGTMLSAIGFWVSWTSNGGSPHGLTPPDGLWVILRPTTLRLLAATLVTGCFARGKGRLFVLGAAIATFAALSLLFMFEMD